MYRPIPLNLCQGNYMAMYTYNRRIVLPIHMQFYNGFTKLFIKKCENGDFWTPAHAYYLKSCLSNSL